MSADQPGKKLGKGMLTFAWVIALGLLTAVFGRWEENQYNPNSDPESRTTGKIKEVVLQSNRQHHYVATGRINGQKVKFLLDTGASHVVIPQKLAQKLQLKPGARGYAHTANGTVEVRSTKLDSLQLGAIRLENVRASINPGMQGMEVLLGMSALKQIEFSQRGNQLTLRQYLH